MTKPKLTCGITPILNGKYLLTSTIVLLLYIFNIQSVEALSANSNYSPHLKTKIASSEAKCERRERERQSVSRKICSGCNRPPILCVCESLPKEKITTSTHVLVLQHPNEFKRKSVSTVPLMPLVLTNCKVQVGYDFKPESLELVQKCLDEGKKPLLLFPGPDAISLDEEEYQNVKTQSDDSTDGSFGYVNDEGGQLLILVDGTWAEARRILIRSPALVDACQQVQFSSEYESIYEEVRKEPEKHCISTLEACAESLILVEPDKNVGFKAKESLEVTMKHMVDVKKRIYKMRNPEPRFVRPGMRGAKIAERGKEIEQSIFGKDADN